MFVLGVAYLLLAVLINIFKRSELEKWFAQSRHDQDKSWACNQAKSGPGAGRFVSSLFTQTLLLHRQGNVNPVVPVDQWYAKW